MKSSSRIIVNTAAQYTRTILNVLLSLWSSRIVLSALGENDFGTYSLVAGVVSMLSFLTNALMASTQRFVSYHQGKGNPKIVEHVFNNSLILHLFIGIFLVAVLEVIEPLLFNGFLNISQERIGASPEQRKQLDIEYARRMSPWFDLKIILRTFTAFIQKENV